MQLTKRQQQIVHTAAGIIAKAGIKGLTIKAIANEIQVTEPALYRHFGKKQDILHTLLACYGETLQESFECGYRQSLGLEQLLHYLEHRDASFAKNPEWARLSFCEEIFYNDSGMAEPIKKLFLQVRSEMETMLNHGQADGSIRKDISVGDLYYLAFGAHRLLLREYCYHAQEDFDYLERSALVRRSLRKILVPTTDKVAKA